MTRRLFVTTALPYANGPFHIGHIMEYIQADIWVRHQRMRGHEVHFVGADDAHGAAIMIAAEKAGKTPQDFVAAIAGGRHKYLDGRRKVSFNFVDFVPLLRTKSFNDSPETADEKVDADMSPMFRHGLTRAKMYQDLYPNVRWV